MLEGEVRELRDRVAEGRRFLAGMEQEITVRTTLAERTPEYEALQAAQAAYEATPEYRIVQRMREELAASKTWQDQQEADLRDKVAGLACTLKEAVGKRGWLGLSGITLRVSHVWACAEQEAESWARQHAPTLFRFDFKAFQKVAPNLPGAPGMDATLYSVAIDRELEVQDA